MTDQQPGSVSTIDPTKRGVDPFLLGVMSVTALLLAAAVYFGIQLGASPQVSADNQVTLTVDADEHDWGTIRIDGGIVSKSFVIRNAGSSALRLYDVQTSCMCTTAQLRTHAVTSRKYGMHEKSTDLFEIQPGETAELVVEFDPASHGPSGVGRVDRIVTVRTNDSSHPELSFYLSAHVVK